VITALLPQECKFEADRLRLDGLETVIKRLASGSRGLMIRKNKWRPMMKKRNAESQCDPSTGNFTDGPDPRS